MGIIYHLTLDSCAFVFNVHCSLYLRVFDYVIWFDCVLLYHVPFHFKKLVLLFSSWATAVFCVKYHSSLSHSTNRSVNWNKLNFTNIGSNLNVPKIDGMELRLMTWRNIRDIVNEISWKFHYKKQTNKKKLLEG